MKNLIQILGVFVICYLFPFLSNAQTTDWQWANNGGGSANMNGNDYRSFEKINNLAVGPDNNYYFIAEVTKDQCSYDGVEFETYNEYTNYSQRDILFFSTTCDGVFRWLKVIGGGLDDFPLAITTDTEGGVYVTGSVFGVTNPSYAPVHYSNDSIKDYGADNGMPNPNNKSLFLIKYNSEGEYQWLNEPQDDPIQQGAARPMNMMTEPNGTTHQLVDLYEGSYFDGELIVPEGEDQVAIIIYGSDGNILNYILLPMETNRGIYNYPFAYDPNNGHYYIADYKPYDDYIVSFGGVPLDTSMYLVCLDSNGNQLWRIDNQSDYEAGDVVGGLSVDEESNIYLTGSSFNVNLELTDNDNDSFAGYEFDQTFSPSSEMGTHAPFLIKLDPDGNLLWGSNPDYGTTTYGRAISFREGEVGLGVAMEAIGNNPWGGVDFERGNGGGTDPMIVRFDKETGEVLGIEDIYGTFGYYDEILAMATDHAGNYVVGGYMTGGLFTQDTDVPPISKNGGQADFFVAQWGDGSCVPLSVKANAAPVQPSLNPNPAHDRVQVSTKAVYSYVLYTLQGRAVKQGKLTATDREIGLQGLESGLYMVRLEDGNGRFVVEKLVVE